jgi:hypothetical protein
MANNGWTPLGKKIDLAREVQGTLAITSLPETIQEDVTDGYNLGTSTDGLPILEGKDASNQLAFYRLQGGVGTSVKQQGNSLIITSTVLSGNTPGVMLTTTYDTNNDGIIDHSALADAVPWTGITGTPATFPPSVHTHAESDVTNLVSDLAGKVPTTRLVTTSFSLQGGGALSADLTLSLIGDKSNVGPDMRYGTDPTGNLGWYPASVGAGDMDQAVYDKNSNGIVDLSEGVVTGGVLTAMLGNGAVTGVKIASHTIPGSAFAATAVSDSLGYVPLNKAGDVASGGITVNMPQGSGGANLWQKAHFLAQADGTGSGCPVIAMALTNQGANSGAVAMWYQGAHGDIQLEYGDGTAAHLLSSISTVSGSQITAGSIPGSALASGAAQTNLGYIPVNGSGGGTYMPGSPIVLQTVQGIGAVSWSVAPLQIAALGGGGSRPQIGFYYPGEAVSLYFEPADWTMRYIDSAGNMRILLDSQHGVSGSQLQGGAAVVNIGYQPVNKGGDTMNGGLRITSDYNATQGQLHIQAAGGSSVAGITMVSRAGYSFSFWAEDNGHVYLICNNDGRTVQLL